MTRFLVIILIAFTITQMSVALPDYDSERDENNIENEFDINDLSPADAELVEEAVAGFTGVLPANMFDDFHIKEQSCTTPKKLLYNLDALTSIISGTETLKSWIEEDAIDTLEDSRTAKPKELNYQMEALVTAAFKYRDETEYALDNATDIIERVNKDLISDATTANFVEKNLAVFSQTPSKLKEGCDILSGIKEKVVTYVQDINNFVKIFKKDIDSASSNQDQFSEIMAGIDDIKTKYNQDEVDIEEAKKDIENLITLLNSEAEAIPSRVLNAKVELENSAKEKGEKLGKDLKGVYNDFQELLNTN